MIIVNKRQFNYALLIFVMTLITSNLYAFNKLKSGIETITSSFLVPLAGAVAGASFIIFITLSFFKQDEYQKKVGNVAILSAFTGGGLELIKTIINTFK